MAKKVSNPKTPWRARVKTEDGPPTHEYRLLMQKASREKDTKAFDMRCVQMRQEAIAFRKTLRPVTETPSQPGLLSDEALAC